MCHIQEAIMGISKKKDMKKIAIMLEHVKIIGMLKTDEEDFHEAVIGLEDVHVHCYESDKVKALKCLNIPTPAIEAFTFDTACDCK